MVLESTISAHGMWQKIDLLASANTYAFRFIKTKIMGPAVVESLTKGGFEFATIEDAATALMKIVSDPSINGEFKATYE